MNEKTLFLSVSGFTIKLIFLPTEKEYEMKKFLSEIRSFYKNFLVGKKRKVAYTLRINNKTSYITSHLHDGRKAIEFYKPLTDKCIETYPIISIMQFNILVHDVVMQLLRTNSGLSFHGSAILLKGKSHIFTGNSGAGKSTIIKLLRKDFQILADDSIYIRKINKRYVMYQTTFKDKEYWVVKGRNPKRIERIYFLEKADHFALKRITDRQEILRLLIEQFWFQDKESLNYHLPIFFDFVSRFREFYKLYFRKEKRGLSNLLNTLV